MERLDQISPLGMLGGQELDGLGPRSPGVLMCVPLRGRYLGKEGLHLVRVIEELPVEIAWVPIDEDAAQVEDHCRRCHIRHAETLALG